MAKKLIAGGIGGGLIYFMWSAFSWMVLPWHNMSLNKFADENVVANAIRSNAPYAGIYLMPNPHKQAEGMTDEMKDTAEQISNEMHRHEAFVFASIRPGGVDFESPLPLITSFCVNVLVGLMITWLLLQAKITGYIKRVGFVKMVALSGAILCNMGYWSWWHFPTGYTLVSILDVGIGWGLAGLLIAKVAD